jgi:hypothetical protein
MNTSQYVLYVGTPPMAEQNVCETGLAQHTKEPLPTSDGVLLALKNTAGTIPLSSGLPARLAIDSMMVGV